MFKVGLALALVNARCQARVTLQQDPSDARERPIFISHENITCAHCRRAASALCGGQFRDRGVFELHTDSCMCQDQRQKRAL